MSRIILGLLIVGTLMGSTVYQDIFFSNWYIDDVTQVERLPSLYTVFAKRIYGDFYEDYSADGGIILGKDDNKACGILFDGSPTFGIGRTLNRFRLGLGYSPKMTGGRHIVAIGFGKDAFRKDFDFAFRYIKPDDGYGIEADLRFRYRARDVVFIPHVSYALRSDGLDYWYINAGIGMRRSIYEEGFIYAAVEYEPWDGDVDTDHIIFQIGLDLPVTRKLSFLTAVRKTLNYRNDWTASATELNPGLRFSYDELHFIMGLRKDLLAEGLLDAVPIINFSVEYDFSNL